MAEVSTRPDVDILDDIHALVNEYPPMRYDRHFVEFSVDAGTIVVTGNVKSAITAKLLATALEKIPGVRSIDLSGLTDDDTLRLQVGHHVPPGVFVNVNYGAVALTGHLLAGVTDVQLVEKITALAGVTRVVTSLS